MPHVAKIVEMLNESELDAFEVMKMPYGENPIYVACGKALGSLGLHCALRYDEGGRSCYRHGLEKNFRD